MYQSDAPNSSRISISFCRMAILKAITVSRTRSETVPNIETRIIPVMRAAVVHDMSVSTMSFWKTTSSTPGSSFTMASRSSRCDGSIAEISSEAGRISAVTISRRSGSSLFCSWYIRSASSLDTYTVCSTFPVCLRRSSKALISSSDLMSEKNTVICGCFSSSLSISCVPYAEAAKTVATNNVKLMVNTAASA